MSEDQNLSAPSDESYEDMGNQDNNDDDDGVNLSLDLDNDDEQPNDDERNKAGLNSPKAKQQELELEDETNISSNPSPATQMRNKYGINSPKGGANKLQWSTAPKLDKTNNNDNSGGGGGGGINSLITQVQRPTTTTNNNNDNSIITQVSQEQNDDTQQDAIQETLTQQQSSFCSFCSCLFTCCSTPKIDTNHNDTNQLTSISPTNKPDTKLLDSDNIKKQINNTNTNDDNIGGDKEESYSSTIYDGNLLPPLSDDKKGKKCLVLDLDETLVHSSFKPIPKPDFIIPVEIDHVVHHVYVLKRPYVDEFLEECAKHYEIVIFTASLSKYADPLLDKLDPKQLISHRLFRESCVIHGTAYVKDLRKLGRKLKNSIIVDNSPPSYLFQPDCAVPITSWFDDPTDTQLRDFIPVLETTLKTIPDVRKVLDAHNKSFRWLCNQANKPLENYGY